jgi:two-component system chemotaxis response regulator CheB
VSRSVLLVDQRGVLPGELEPVLQGELRPTGPPVAPASALEAVRRLSPDLVLVEVLGESPDVTKLVERVMSDVPRPIVLMARGPAARQAAFGLLAAGALDVLALSEPLDVSALRRQLMLLAGVTVVRHPKGRKRRTSAGLPALRPDYPLVAIASSLGGPRALVEVLGELPAQFAAPIVVCQHITPGFTDELAQWLATETRRRVHEAVDGQQLVRGEVFVAPAHLHMRVGASGRVRLDDGAPVGGFKPACDVLLSSVAESFGPRAIGVVLTGMGRDGALGLLEIRRRGGRTIAQDEASSVVFGMPGEAVALGAAEAVLPLDQIAAQLERWAQ